MRVANVAVAVHAGEHLAAIVCRQHLVNDCCVAIHASSLCHTPITRLDLNRLVEVFQRERQRVKKAVVGFRYQFANFVVGQVAIVANRHMTMAGLQPGIVMSLHDVAISTSRRIIAQIARAFAITEREQSHAAKDAKHGSQQDGE